MCEYSEVAELRRKIAYIEKQAEERDDRLQKKIDSLRESLNTTKLRALGWLWIVLNAALYYGLAKGFKWL